MTLQQLHYFVVTANMRSFTRAAEACMVSQPALSHAIRELEQELGCDLFERCGRCVILTEEGQLCLSEADEGGDQLARHALTTVVQRHRHVVDIALVQHGLEPGVAQHRSVLALGGDDDGGVVPQLFQKHFLAPRVGEALPFQRRDLGNVLGGHWGQFVVHIVLL